MARWCAAKLTSWRPTLLATTTWPCTPARCLTGTREWLAVPYTSHVAAACCALPRTATLPVIEPVQPLLCTSLRPCLAPAAATTCRSYVVGLLVPRDAVKRAMYWDTAEPYHYTRLENWDDNNLLLIVGAWVMLR